RLCMVQDVRELPARVQHKQKIIKSLATRVDSTSKDIQRIQQFMTPTLEKKHTLKSTINEQATYDLCQYLEITLTQRLKLSLDSWKKKVIDMIKDSEERRMYALDAKCQNLLHRINTMIPGQGLGRSMGPIVEVAVPGKRNRTYGNKVDFAKPEDAI
ncbi:hypothetical protein BDK51DRAFT_34807, partial [Blyttiomyces helicus]